MQLFEKSDKDLISFLNELHGNGALWDVLFLV